MHATGSLVHESNAGADQNSTRGVVVDKIDLAAARAGMSAITSREDFYRLMAERGSGVWPVVPGA